MDATPMQSGSKCGGSDFSIERILSDRKETREESVEVPEWLCCTRYRPPRLPRAATVCRSRRAGRHARVPFTAAQAAALEAAYARAPYLAPPALKALAAALQLRDDRIKIWFQNRRARERREKTTTIAPPQGVTLTPTTLASTFPPHIWISQTNFSITRSAQNANAQSLDRLINIPQAITSNDIRNVNPFGTPLNCSEIIDSHSSISSSNCSKVDDDRSSTPLDIETVED